MKAAKGLFRPKHDDLRRLLHQKIAGMEQGRPIGNLHASEVTKPEFCSREAAIGGSLGRRTRDEFVSTSMRVTFDLGWWVERYVVDHFVGLGKTVGHWVCGRTPHRCQGRVELSKRPWRCPICSAEDSMQYESVRVRSPITGVSAGLDVLLDLGKPRLVLVEVKSLDKEQFKSLQAPFAEHRIRTRLYLRTVQEAGGLVASLVDPDVSRVLYVSKGGFGVSDGAFIARYQLKDAPYSPFKEYEVYRDDEETEPYAKKAKAAWEAMQKVGPWPVRICALPTDKRARSCTVWRECFGPEFLPKEG